MLSFIALPRVAGSTKAKSLKLSIKGESFDLDVITLDNEQIGCDKIWVETAKGLNRKNIGRDGRSSIRIQPKPPKIQITLPNLLKDYLTDEDFSLNIGIFNGEEGAAEVDVEIRFLGELGAIPRLGWISVDDETTAQQSTSRRSSVDQGNKSLAVLSLGIMQGQENRTIRANFNATSLPAEAVLEVKALYHVLSAPDTPLSKVSINDVIFYRPFEANYDFEPCTDSSIWPNYFDVDEQSGDDLACGLKQRWRSTVKLASFAAEPLFIEDMQLRTLSLHDGAKCSIIDANNARFRGATVAPNDFSERHFQILAQKVELDDRRSTALELQLEVCWRRDRPGAVSATTTLPVPGLVIPFGEPRVLASTSSLQNEPIVVSLEYTIENPSTHVLNFELSMDASEDFAFSGPKTTSVQLVPVSRHTVRYHLMPLARGIWIAPYFRVLDTHFNQVLKVYGTGGVRTDKKGISIWIDRDE